MEETMRHLTYSLTCLKYIESLTVHFYATARNRMIVYHLHKLKPRLAGSTDYY